MASKTSLALVAALSIGVPLSLARAQTGTSAFPGVDPATIEDLVLANRILANEKVLDGFGHVSIRDPRNPNRYLMSRSIAPATVTADDIMEYNLDRKSTRLNSSHLGISYAVFCLKKKKNRQ